MFVRTTARLIEFFGSSPHCCAEEPRSRVLEGEQSKPVWTDGEAECLYVFAGRKTCREVFDAAQFRKKCS